MSVRPPPACPTPAAGTPAHGELAPTAPARPEAPPEPEARAAAGWVRFSRYELRDGLVRPAAGARAEPYDPWAAYSAARGGWGGRGGRAPYESLLALVWSVRLRPGRPGDGPRLDPAGERAVLAWCAANGLLGLLPHEADVAYLAPRWAAAPTAAGRLAVVARGYGYGCGAWTEITEVGQPSETPAAREGELAAPGLWPALWAPGVYGRALGRGSWARCPLGAAWGPYFPDVPADQKEAHAYPRPLSAAFWAAYGEPIELFLAAAALLADALRRLGGGRRGSRAPCDGASTGAVDPALASLTAGAQPALHAGPSGWERAWRTKSLLGTLATMACLDLAAGWRILGCDECGAPFAAVGYQARYCSARCRNTAVKRAYRARLRRRAGARAPRPPPSTRGAAFPVPPPVAAGGRAGCARLAARRQ